MTYRNSFSIGDHHYINVEQVTGGMIQFYFFGERPLENSNEWKPIAFFYKHK